MNRTSIVALVIGALLFGCGAGMVAHEVLESEAVAYEGQKWEYTQFISGVGGKKALAQANELGNEGWEMLAIDGSEYMFKRPLN